MKFQMPKGMLSLTALVRNAGYRPIGYTPEGELNCVRPLGGDYPRFHVYVKEQPDLYLFSLHLDQKKPSYGHETAHSGEYEGDLVSGEAQRIKASVRI